jgi:hypothetical protein
MSATLEQDLLVIFAAIALSLSEGFRLWLTQEI